MEGSGLGIYLGVEMTWFVSGVYLKEVSKEDERTKEDCQISDWKNLLGGDIIYYDQKAERMNRLEVEIKTEVLNFKSLRC